MLYIASRPLCTISVGFLNTMVSCGSTLLLKPCRTVKSNRRMLCMSSFATAINFLPSVEKVTAVMERKHASISVSSWPGLFGTWLLGSQ